VWSSYFFDNDLKVLKWKKKWAKKSIISMEEHLEQQEFATEKDVKYVNELVKHLNSSVDKAKHQSLLIYYKFKSREMINCLSYIPP